MTHTLTLQDCRIQVLFQEHSIHITNDKGLWALIASDPVASTKMLTDEIFRTFEAEEGRAFEVHPDSLTVEIWGHVYCEYFALVIEKLIALKLVALIADKIISYCEVIDCGEKGFDHNRSLWDTLAPFVSLIAGWLPENIDDKKLK